MATTKKSSVPPSGKKKTAAKKKQVRPQFKTPPFVISYPYIFDARENDDGSEKFSACAIFHPPSWPELAKRISKNPDATLLQWQTEWKAIRAEFKRLAVEVWDCAPDGNWMSEMRERELRTGLRPGSSRKGEAGYPEGSLFFNMSSSADRPPDVIARDKSEISKKVGNTKEIYPGAICRATIVIYDYDVKGGRGITVGMNNVQKLAEGPRIDNRKKAADDFDDDGEAEFLDDDGEDGDNDEFGDGEDTGADDDFD
jgi:hypothetical protein